MGWRALAPADRGQRRPGQPDHTLNDRVYSCRMILLRKAYRGHYIEIRPVSPQPADGALPGRARIWIDGEPLERDFACPRAALLPDLLKIATDAIDTASRHQA